MIHYLAVCGILISLIFEFPCILCNNLATINKNSVIDRFTTFSKDIPEILSGLKTVVIAIDGDYDESMEILEDLVPQIKRNHSVLVYYLNWTLEKRDLCHIHWQYESMKGVVIHEEHRRKRSISGNGNILSSFQNTWFRRSITGYILVISLNMLMNTMECIVEPLGVYLIIIDAPATESVLDIMREHLLIGWAIKRSFQIYVMLLNETFTLHPFAQDPMRNDSYGVLMKFNQRPLNILKDLNGYPLRIEMFHSAFNFQRTDPQTGAVRFEGTDAEVMRSLKAFMNFSGNIFRKLR